MPSEASQSVKPASQARGQSDMVIWRIPAHTLAHTLLVYGPRVVGPGRPGHPGHPAGRPNEAKQVASQLEAARLKKAAEAACRKQAGQPGQAGLQATQASEHNMFIP